MRDGKRLYFTANVQSRQAQYSIDAATGATRGVVVHTADSCASMQAECGKGEDGSRRFRTTVHSLTMPLELFIATASD